MKCIDTHFTYLALILAGALILASCAGESTGATVSPPATSETPQATALVPNDSPTPAATAAPTTTVEIDDDELIAAALAAYEAAPQPEETIAWDVLDSTIDETTGTIKLTLCTWDGLTAFDVVRDVRYGAEIDSDGTITTRNVQASPTSGDCLNTQLIDTAIATANARDDYWSEVLLTPEIFRNDPRSLQIFTETAYIALLSLTNQWVDDDVHFREAYVGRMPEDAEAPILWRRYDTDNGTELGIVTCRNMGTNYGLYRNDTLLDNFKDVEELGPHAANAYQLVAHPSSPTSWLVEGSDGLVWGDCFNTGDWPGAVNDWQPGPAMWTEVE